MTVHRGKRVSDGEFRRLWEDMSLSKQGIGRILGISGNCVQKRASARNLPARPGGQPFARIHDHKRILRLYGTGLSREVVARMMGCTASTVIHALRVAGVTLRGRHHPAAMTEAQALAIMLAASARETRAQMVMAEMVDGRQDRRWPTDGGQNRQA